MRFTRSTWTSLLAFLPLLAAPLAAEPSIPGAEQRVNERANLTQRNPMAAFAPSGASLVVWENDLVGLQGRLFARDGSPAGPELTLVANQQLEGIPAAGEITVHKHAAIAMLPSGSFLLFWTEERGHLSLDYFFYEYQLGSRQVMGRLFDASGQPAGQPFRVDGGAAGLHSLPEVAVRGSDVAVVWSLDDRASRDRAVMLRLFDHRGRATSGPVRVSPAGEQGTFPAVAAGAGNRLLVAWEGEDGDQRGILAQLFDGAATPVGGAFRVNSDVAGRQRRPAIAAARDGFLVLWNGPFESPSRTRIFGQLVGMAGNLVGGQVTVSPGSVEKELVPAVAAGRDGSFLAAWLGYRQIFPAGVFAIELDATGAPVGEAVKLNRRAVGANQFLSIAGDGKGGFVIPWQGFIRRQPGISIQRPVQE